LRLSTNREYGCESRRDKVYINRKLDARNSLHTSLWSNGRGCEIVQRKNTYCWPLHTNADANLGCPQTKIHSLACYDIGPYASSKDYILACYDREIYFYTHADPVDIEDFFEDLTSTVDDFVRQLKSQRQELEDGGLDIFRQIDSEPLVLVHEDFHAGNMLVRDGKVVGVLDWEFSGVYPLSQLLLPAQILQISMPLSDRDDQTESEEDRWDERYRRMVGEIVKERGWAEKDVQTLLSGGHVELKVARNIMFPHPE
jgi:hypothetical protein